MNIWCWESTEGWFDKHFLPIRGNDIWIESWITIDNNVGAKTIKVWEENICDPGLDIFSEKSEKAQTIK